MKNKDYLNILMKGLIASCILTVITPLYAQEWPYSNSFEPDTNDPRYFENVKNQFSEYLIDQRYSNIIWYLKIDFEHQSTLWQVDSLQYLKNNFINAIEHFYAHIDSIFKDDSKGIDDIHGAFFLSTPGRRTPPTPLKFFSGTEFEFSLTSYKIPHEEAEDLRYRINTLHRITDIINNDSRLDLQRELNRLNNQWRNFHFSGRSQYPWEFIANNLFVYRSKRPMVKPPGFSLIFLHPNASISLDFTDSDHLKTHQTLSLEVIGGAFSFNDFKSNAGLSYLFVVNNSLGNGHGIMLSYNNFKMGTVWHDEFLKGTNLVFSLDLFKLFGSSKEMLESLRN